MATVVLDGELDPLSVGCRVTDGDGFGTVTAISDPDGEYIDGVARGINPRVAVLFEDGTDDEYPTSDMRRGPNDDESYQCEDLVVAEPSR